MIRSRYASPAAATSMMAALLVAVAGLAGCANGPASAAFRPPQPLPVPAIPLATGGSVVGASWATVQVSSGGTAARRWQLLVRDPVTGRWRVATPPSRFVDTGLAVAGQPFKGLTVGFIPPVLTRLTPLAVSKKAGIHWRPSLLPAGLVREPDSLAMLTGGSELAVTGTDAEISAPGALGWRPLVTLAALAATAAGKQCGLTGLTSAGAGPDGLPMLAGTCSRRGVVGLFVHRKSGWHLTGPSLPSSLAKRPVSVLGLASPGHGNSMLIGVATGHSVLAIPATRLLAATTWSIYPQLGSTVTDLTSATAGLNGTWALSFDGNHGLITTPPYTVVTPPDQGQASSQAGHHKHGKASGHPGVSGPRTQPSSRRALELPAADAVLVPGTTSSGPDGPTALVPTVDSVVVYQLSAQGTWQQGQLLSVDIGMPRPLKR
jgi:hypothetical protein